MVRSVALRNVERMSSLLVDDGSEDEEEESHLHGRMVDNTTTGKFSLRILAINSGMATAPGPIGRRWRKNRMTVWGCLDRVD
mmetsp:Transcript_1853/g.3820  ORF Transcript_1853/g.3820 Transcript_1853/m.3820 type:complete len:82 (-) Transcript_1853:1214-1459(-)